LDTHDIVVVSDMHLGEGRAPSSIRYAPTEDFFHDASFARFLEHIKSKYRDDPSRVLLVLNGDIFDFITVTRIPDDEEAGLRGFKVFAGEHKFGLNPTEAKSIYKLETIARGHLVFFRALAVFVAAGHRVELVRGNHDLELYFPGVRERLLELLASFEGEGGASLDTLRERVGFNQLFYREEGRIHIEHGHQYDSANSIRYPLRPIWSRKRWWRKDDEETDEMLDYPLGSIFVKFFYNRVRRLDPYAPRLLSPQQYMDFIRRYNLFDVWRVFRDHYPYFIAALGPSTPLGRSDDSEEEDARQDKNFKELAKCTGAGELYSKWSMLRIHPESASKGAVFSKIVEPVIRKTLWFGGFAFVLLYVWLLLFKLIQAVPTMAANALLTSIFAVITLGGAAWTWIHLQRKLRLRQQKHHRTEVDAAEKVAALSKVPIILMGHTHLVDHHAFDSGVIYANSGTWSTVANPWNRIMRDARRLTFLYVAGSKLHLKRWNDDALRFDDVPLFLHSTDDIVETGSGDLSDLNDEEDQLSQELSDPAER